MRDNAVKSSAGILWEAYKKLFHTKAIEKNTHQEELLRYYQYLYDCLEHRHSFPFIFKPSRIKGLYVWGEIGRGKTLLMDIFYNQIMQVPKRRVHFHEFMKEIHTKLHAQEGNAQKTLAQLIKQMACETKLLCLDEFQVTNIADAMIMSRLFQGLFQKGVVIVATSNTEPERLYEKGLHRELFAPFIPLLLKYMSVFHLEGDKDYRRMKLLHQKRYFTPCNKLALKHLQSLWDEVTDKAPLEETAIKKGSSSVLLVGFAKGVAWARFHDLCMRPCGRGEYLALAEKIHTLILSGIPKMTLEDHNEASRFTILIDILYDKGVWLIIAAEAAPEDLYPHSESFERTVSRLYEMQHG